MKSATQKVIDFPEETVEQRVAGVHSALEYITNECLNLGLSYTAHMTRGAAYAALGEFEKIGAKAAPEQGNTPPYLKGMS